MQEITCFVSLSKAKYTFHQSELFARAEKCGQVEWVEIPSALNNITRMRDGKTDNVYPRQTDVIALRYSKYFIINRAKRRVRANK